MKTLREEIEELVRNGLSALLGPDAEGLEPMVRPTQDPRFGDYQSNVALSAAGKLGRKPRELAEAIAARIDGHGTIAPVEVAGPGFLNFRFLPGYLGRRLEAIQADPRLGVEPAAPPMRIVVDFSSPNLAKEMHVGHLRTTVIGDSLCRLMEFQGHDVLRLNHVGDWGTQFGMLLQHLRESRPEVMANPDGFRLADLEEFYREAKARFDADAEFRDAARRSVVELQSGYPTALRLWRTFCDESLRHAHALYDLLEVRLIDRGESFYSDRLPAVVEDLLAAGLAVEDAGAVCVFVPGFVNREGNPLPVIVRKSDGGYNYATTDLAAIRHRVDVEGARRIVYVTDVRQADHFAQVFAIARMAGWAPDSVALEHVGYGMVLGADRRPFKTREGDTIRLRDLLDEAIARADAAIDDGDGRREQMDPAERALVARAVGIGAVKYADLSHNPASDYVFDWDTMLSLDGNTAPYLLYAYARARSVFRRAGMDPSALPAGLRIILEHPTELELGRHLLGLAAVLAQMSAELKPSVLTEYLYGLARAFSSFYDRDRGVRVLDAKPDEVRLSRLRLCDLTARTLALGLGILGIPIVERM